MPLKYINSKQKNSETKPYPLCLRNVSKDFIVLIRRNRIIWLHVQFSVDYNIIDISDIINIQKYLMK